MSARTGLLLLSCLVVGTSAAQAVPPVVKWSSDAARWAPAFLQVVDRHSDRRKVRVRVYADSDYRANVPRWQEKARAMFDDLNLMVGPTFGVRFEIETFRRWEETPRGMSAEGALHLLEAHDPGEDVDWVVGFIPALPLLNSSMHHTGMARKLGRHFVLRGMADLEEARDIKTLQLSKTEEDQLYTARKWHKEIAVFLHEWGHTLGAIHSSDPVNLMSPQHSQAIQMFSNEQMKAMDLGLACRLGQPAVAAWRCQPLLTYLEKTNSRDWFAEDRQELLEVLRAGMTGRGVSGAPESSDPSRTAAQVRSWNNVLQRLDDAREAVENGARADALRAVARADEEARGLPQVGGERPWLAIARGYQALGAITRAEQALAHAGTEPGTTGARAELLRARRTYGLPWPKTIAPEAEPEYIRAFDALAKGLSRTSDGAVAKALQTYPEAPGLLMLECEVHSRAGRARQADKSCKAALDAAPELARAHYLLGMLDSSRNRSEEAVTHLRKAVDLDPLAGHHWSSLSGVYRKNGKSRELQELAAEYEKRFNQKLP